MKARLGAAKRLNKCSYSFREGIFLPAASPYVLTGQGIGGSTCSFLTSYQHPNGEAAILREAGGRLAGEGGNALQAVAVAGYVRAGEAGIRI